jgi:hypothetical protein
MVVGVAVFSGVITAAITGLGRGDRLTAVDLAVVVGAIAIGSMAGRVFASFAPSAERLSVWIQLVLGYAAGVLVVAFFPALERLWG